MNAHPGTNPERFAAALEAVGGQTLILPTRAEAVDVVRRLCGDRPVVVDKHPDLDGIADTLNAVADPWEAEIGVTGAVAAAEETGTLALAFDSERPRSTSLVPPVHVAVVPASRLVPTYADAIAALADISPTPSGMNLITGPSSSSDIEMTQVRGVHGPGEIHVILYRE